MRLSHDPQNRSINSAPGECCDDSGQAGISSVRKLSKDGRYEGVNEAFRVLPGSSKRFHGNSARSNSGYSTVTVCIAGLFSLFFPFSLLPSVKLNVTVNGRSRVCTVCEGFFEHIRWVRPRAEHRKAALSKIIETEIRSSFVLRQGIERRRLAVRWPGRRSVL
jgi:hypothetical protein